jgi:hypothetical protein
VPDLKRKSLDEIATFVLWTKENFFKPLDAAPEKGCLNAARKWTRIGIPEKTKITRIENMQQKGMRVIIFFFVEMVGAQNDIWRLHFLSK